MVETDKTLYFYNCNRKFCKEQKGSRCNNPDCCKTTDKRYRKDSKVFVLDDNGFTEVKEREVEK